MTASIVSANFGSGYYRAHCSECKWYGTKFEHFDYGRRQAWAEAEIHNDTICP